MEFEVTATKLRKLDRGDLEDLLFRVSQSHIALCNVTSAEVDPHAEEGVMRERISKLDTGQIVAALAPLAVLAEAAHEHHPGHEDSHR